MPETDTKQRGHFTLKAVTQVVTDEGVFEAVISTDTIDREKDIVEPSAMVAALKKWNRPIPLAWDHSTAAEDIIGSIEPMTVREQGGEVFAQGQVDLESKRGAEAWRSFKSGVIGFSYGYLIPDGGATERKGGGKHITELDVFEVTATPTPMNNDTRVLSTKGLDSEQAEGFLSDLRDGWESVEDDLSDEAKANLARKAMELLGLGDEQDELRKQSGQLERDLQGRSLSASDPAQLEARLRQAEDAMFAAELFDPGEVEGLKAGRLKAVWSAAYINDLPDSAFLYIEPGGEKDDGGKTTPRSLRHFPYKDTDGKVDLPHLRNALSRIPQSNLSQEIKDRLAARAQRILDNEKSVDVADKEPIRARSVDPLRKRSQEAVLEIQSDGLSLRQSPTKKAEPKPEPASESDLRRRSRDLMLELLTGESQ